MEEQNETKTEIIDDLFGEQRRKEMNAPEETDKIVTEMWERNYEPTVKDGRWLEKEINELLDGFFYKSHPDVAVLYEAGLREEIGGLIEEIEEQNETKTEIIDDPFGEQRRMENERRKEMKYKTGDKVKVREDLEKLEYAVTSKQKMINVEKEMISFAGEVVTISGCDPMAELYWIQELPGFSWTDGMFEGLAATLNLKDNAIVNADDPIQPDHYRKGEIDLYESWYRTYPFNEFRAIMSAIAERYMKRDKVNRIEDLDKAIYTLTRLKEYEVQHEGD